MSTHSTREKFVSFPVPNMGEQYNVLVPMKPNDSVYHVYMGISVSTHPFTYNFESSLELFIDGSSSPSFEGTISGDYLFTSLNFDYAFEPNLLSNSVVKFRWHTPENWRGDYFNFCNIHCVALANWKP